MADCCENKSCEIDALRDKHRRVLKIVLAFGIGVLAEAGWKAFHPVLPQAVTMGLVGALALAANLLCFVLLYAHRADNVNMSSTWLCSRNDLVANTGVLLAAWAGYALASRWPDILVGTLIAVLFVSSALHVIRQARMAMQEPKARSVRQFKAVSVEVRPDILRNEP